jgi:hypothetical protein
MAKKPLLKAVPSRAPSRTVTTTTPFDYDKWLANEPTLQSSLLQNRLSGSELGTQLVGGVQQLYGRLGDMPPDLSALFARLPQEVRNQLAASMPDLQAAISAGNQAGTSALARLGYDYRLDQSQDVHRLGGMGALRSGAYGQESAKNLRALTLGQYDTRLAATDALNELQGSYLSGKRELSGQAADALTAAQTKASGLIGLGRLGPSTTTRTVANPYLNPAAPKQVSTPTHVGSTTTYEPHATAGNIIPPAPTVPKPKAAPYKPPNLGFRALR